MRFVKVPLFCLLLVLALTGVSQAQHFGCDDLTTSSYDAIRIPFFCGIPGDTVLVPIILEHDSIITSFQFLIEYDADYLSPIFIRDSSCAIADDTGCISWNVDTTYIDHLIAGRMLKTDTTQGEFGPVIDTINQFTINLFQNEQNVMAANMVPEFLTLDSLPPGNDTIFYIKMLVDEDMPHLTYTSFEFFQSDIFVIDSSGYPPDTTFFNGCNTSQLVSAWRVAPDSTVGYQIYPNTDPGYTFWFQADTACEAPQPEDPTVDLTASPTAIDAGGSSTLSWTSTWSDSVVVRDQFNTRLSNGTNGATSGAFSVSPTTTTSYTATAYGVNGNTASDAVTVTVGGVEPGEGPIVTVIGNQTVYNQGELISFTVTATNTNSTQISIVASLMPANASFGTTGTVVGVTPLSGTFSWTPDFNQSGAYTIRFTATDGEGTTIRNEALSIQELQFDRLFSTSRAGNRPVGGLPGREAIAFPIDLVTSQMVFGVQFDMSYPSHIIRVDSFVTTARIPDYVVYDNVGQTPGDIRVVTFGLDNEPVNDTNTTAILNAILTLDSSAVPWTDYVIHLANGRESVNPDPNVGSLPLVTDSGLVAVDSLGDVNLDRSIDVADAVNIVSHIIQTFTLSSRQHEVADVMTNDTVNVFDLVADVNMIFGVPLPASPAPAAPGEVAIMAMEYDDVSTGGSELLVVSSEIPQEVAGVQLELNYDPSSVSFGSPRLTGDNANYALHSNDNGRGRLKILLYNFAPRGADDFMQPGQVDLVEIPITAYANIKADDKTKIRLTEALLSTTSAASIAAGGIDAPLPSSFTLMQNYPNPFNPSTTIKFELGVTGAGQQLVNLDIYNILGQHVNSLIDGYYPSGEHEVVWDATNNSGQRVATGIYLYRLKVGDDFKTKKMLFLK